jgi:hypothetical protein
MMRALTWLHGWLGVALCLLFAMWFASGMVMHFVPFPSLTEAERVAGLPPVDFGRVARGPAEAAAASGIADATRVRLIQRSDGPVYLVANGSSVIALHADDLSAARVSAPDVARAIVLGHARQRGLSTSVAGAAEIISRDQWTVTGDLDRHRPLYRIALNDDARTELYLSSATGEVVRDTTRRERWWNMVGSIPHWLYVTALRGQPRLWTAVLWTLSLAGTISAFVGGVLGIARIGGRGGRFTSPYGGWQLWHHLGGLACMTFVLTWMFSGFLSMDNGRLFPGARLTASEAAILAAPVPADAWPRGVLRSVAAVSKETEWFGFDRRLYRRDRLDLNRQILTRVSGDEQAAGSDHLAPRDIAMLAQRLGPRCTTSVMDRRADAYVATASMPDAAVYRAACEDVWFDIDGASGVVIERLDTSRRTYRWLYRALHTWDVPMLTAHPALRSTLIVVLCGGGFLFSLTGCVIGWKRFGRALRANS